MAQKFSLSFTKKIEKKILDPSIIRNDIPVKKSTVLENIESVEDNVIKTDYEEQKEELVIPLIQENRDNIIKKIKQKISKKENEPEEQDISKLTLDERAALELIKESKETVASTNDRSKELSIAANSTATSLKDDNIVSLGKLASNDDYEDIPIDSFGSAMLRGMGWKNKGGIGKHDKDIIPVDPLSFARVLGESKDSKKRKKVEQDENLELKVGSFIYIHSGRRAGQYGKVKYVVPEYLNVELAMGRGDITEVEANIKVVTKTEYDGSSRVINKKSYDTYKAQQELKNKKEEVMSEDEDITQTLSGGTKKSDAALFDKISKLKEAKKIKDETRYNYKTQDIKQEDLTENKRDDENNKQFDKIKIKEEKSSDIENVDRNYKERNKDNKRHKPDKQEYIESEKKYKSKERETSSRDYDKYSSKDKYSDTKSSKYYSKADKKKSKHDSLSKYKGESLHSPLPVMPWVQENLKVRIISKSYKGGKYYKEKVVVTSVITPEECECKTSEGKLLTSIHPDWLETVIPKDQSTKVLIVNGKYKSQYGRIIDLHKSEEKASIQLVSDGNIVKLYFENICEYVR